ncbi:MAG: hypothetical protein GF375_01610, partial [Candidatus Omnitrophica bacterium]|nr:hypothetical protein [Candidatus Omnitrophota bacterium]MBD3268824.1 hypothetical protein [Candidatus Omnitrophota bacterium]
MKDKNNSKIKFIPDFDSSSTMLFSLGNFLSGAEEGVSLPARLPKMVGDIVNIGPEKLRESIYRLSGTFESLNVKSLRLVNDEYISNWITESYPKKKYPAIMIGSSNGALIHICAALGIPWIPQTILLAVSRKMHPDELLKDAEWGKGVAETIRKKLPYMRAYQMHDPIQDRVMVANMGYFRVKRLRLGEYLKDYISKALIPGGTIFISDCRYKWPVVKISRNHYFQLGGLGDVGGEEYHKGSRRIKDFLKRQGSPKHKWEIPSPLSEAPESEWGFDEELSSDIKKYAKKKRYKIKRIVYNHPEELSPAAADLSRYWYKKSGIKDK